MTKRGLRINRFRPTWPKEKLDEVKRLWLDGHSALVIAEQFGTTRNAVMGIVHRHQMHRSPSAPVKRLLNVPQLEDEPWLEVEPEPLPQALPDLYQLQKPRSRRPRTPEALPASIGMTMLALTPTSCRWPISGSGVAALFCGMTTAQPPYCAEHTARGTGHSYPMRIRLPT